MTSTESNTANATSPGALTHAEIFSQPGSWQSAISAVNGQKEAIRALFARHDAQPVVFVGCGSPYYLDMTAAAAYRSLTGKWAIALPASEILFNIENALPGNVTPLVVAVSRSGETSELLAACRLLKEKRGSPIVLITVSEGASLERLADATVYIPNASEQSVAQTRSFAAMLIATLGTVAIVANNDALVSELSQVSALGPAYLDRIKAPIAALIGRGFEQIFFLGSGLRHGLAHEGSLKMKEMSISNSEPFHFMEFRHGPQSMIDEHTLVVGLVSGRAADAETKVLREMTGYGGTVIAVHPKGVAIEGTNIVDISLPGGFSEIASLVYYMPALHLLAYNQAMLKGVNCDSPRNLHAWIKLPELR